MTTRQHRLRASFLGTVALAAALAGTQQPASALFGEADIRPVESNLATKHWVTVSASSGAGTADHAIDQNPGTAWVATEQQPGQWIALDLGGAYDNVRKLEVVFPDAGATYRYLVEASSDGVSWDVLADRTEGGEASRGAVELFTRRGTRHVRVTITGTSPGATVGVSELSVFNYLRDDLILGADLSWVDDNTFWGGQYFIDPDDPSDPGPHVLDVVQDRGMGYIRLRIFNEPRAEDAAATLLDPPFQGPERSAEVARWIKADRGMGLGIDFHYADSWADPGKQPKPRAWADLPFDELVDAVYDYTYDYIELLIEQGTIPDRVAVGNEIINGFLYGSEAEHIGTTNPPYFSAQADLYQSEPGGGLLWAFWGSNDPVERQLYEEAWDRFTTLAASGIRAVRDVSDAHVAGIEVEIHVIIDNGGLGKTLEFWDQYLTRVGAKGEEPDVLAHSYYPQWHGSPDHFEFNLNAIAAAHPDYKINIAETSYPAGVWEGSSRVDGPPLPNSPYPQTIQGQADAIQHVFRIANDIPDNRGIGALVWEPTEWDTLFSFDNGWPTVEANASLDVFDQSHATHVLEHAIHRRAGARRPLALPPTVRVLTTADGSIAATPVTWDVPLGATDQPRTLTIAGSSAFGNVVAIVDVIQVDPICTTFDRSDMGWDWNAPRTVTKGGITVTNPAGTHDDWVWRFAGAPLQVTEVSVFSNGGVQQASTTPGVLRGLYGSNLQWARFCYEPAL